jgi:hypothetical protein
MSSQTAVLPLPSCDEETIRRSGKRLGFDALQSKVEVPGFSPLGPRIASTTMKNPCGTGRSKTGVPPLVSTGVATFPSALAIPK